MKPIVVVVILLSAIGIAIVDWMLFAIIMSPSPVVPTTQCKKCCIEEIQLPKWKKT